MLLAPLISLGAKRTAIRVAPEACFWRKVATGCSSRIHGGNEATCAMSAACHRRGGKEAKEPRQQSPAVRVGGVSLPAENGNCLMWASNAMIEATPLSRRAFVVGTVAAGTGALPVSGTSRAAPEAA